jgi:transposase
MSGVLRIDIQESAATLKTLLDQQSSAVQRSKIQVLWWIKTGQANQVNQLAQLSGYHRTTVSTWLSKYRQGGLPRLLAITPKPGRPRAISSEVLRQLQQELQAPAGGFTSYGKSRPG